MSESSPAAISNDWFKPTWRRTLFAAALAAGAFLLPQEIPLEWYPLNNPGTDINYLEISCASNVNGEVQIRYDVGRLGNRSFDNIRIPISPTTQTFTYTFPLPDAPIVEMRVLPPAGGELTIRQMRIINRRNEEVRRFTHDLFRVERDSATIMPSTEGWKLIAAPGAANPSTRIELFSPIVPVGKDHRNFLRCLLSTGYLSMMLWILLLAVLFTFYRPQISFTRRKQSGPSQDPEQLSDLRDLGVESSDRKSGWRDLWLHLGFMASLAILFAFVGNRGLIRNSVHHARYVAPVIPPGLKLELDLTSTNPSLPAQVFWDTGAGFNEAESARAQPEPHSGQQTFRFPLPDKPIQALRFDPLNGATQLQIRGIRLVDAGQRTAAVLPLDSLKAVREIARLEVGADVLTIEVTPEGKDPIMEFTPAAVAAVNRAQAGQINR